MDLLAPLKHKAASTRAGAAELKLYIAIVTLRSVTEP
jgi:hypothetical protein